MATYVNDLRLTEIATGDESGTWGTITNTNLELIGEGLSYATEDCFTSDADATATVAPGATDPARAMYFKVTSSATLTATRTLTIAPNDMSRLQFIENATTGSQSINISQGSGSNVTIPSGQTKAVYMDGAGATAAVVDAFSLLNLNLADNVKLNFGASDDLQIYHDGSDSFVTDAGTGSLKLCGTNLTLKNSADNKTYLFASDGGAVDLRYDNSAKIATTNTGVDITGNATFSDNDKAIFGDGNDGFIYSDGTHLIVEGQNADSDIRLLSDDRIYIGSKAAGETFAIFNDDGAVDLYFDGTKRLATISTGVNILGDLDIDNDVEVTGRSVGVTITPENDGSFDLSVCNDFTCTTTTATEITFTNAAAGQSGNIKFVNGGNHAITADTMVAINANVLSTLSATGTYHLAYYVTAASGNDTILVSASAALT